MNLFIYLFYMNKLYAPNFLKSYKFIFPISNQFFFYLAFSNTGKDLFKKYSIGKAIRLVHAQTKRQGTNF